MKHIAIIFISGMVTKDEEGKSYINIGGQSYPAIGKPLNPAILLERVEENTRVRTPSKNKEMV